MEERRVIIPDIHCGNCLNTIVNEIGDLDGVINVEGNVASREVIIQWRQPANWEIIEAELNEIGFPPVEE